MRLQHGPALLVFRWRKKSWIHPPHSSQHAQFQSTYRLVNRPMILARILWNRRRSQSTSSGKTSPLSQAGEWYQIAWRQSKPHTTHGSWQHLQFWPVKTWTMSSDEKTLLRTIWGVKGELTSDVSGARDGCTKVTQPPYLIPATAY